MASPSIQTPKKTNKTGFLGSFRLEHKPKGLIRKGKLGFAQYNQQDDTSSLTDLENTIFIKFPYPGKKEFSKKKIKYAWAPKTPDENVLYPCHNEKRNPPKSIVQFPEEKHTTNRRWTEVLGFF